MVGLWCVVVEGDIACLIGGNGRSAGVHRPWGSGFMICLGTQTSSYLYYHVACTHKSLVDMCPYCLLRSEMSTSTQPLPFFVYNVNVTSVRRPFLIHV